MAEAEKSFWEHLDDLRASLIKIFAATLVFMVLAFCFKDLLFKIVLAPKDSSFFIYQILGGEEFSINLMNIGLTEQFIIHLKTAFAFGVLLSSPYTIKVLFNFISPALYKNEKKYSIFIVFSSYIMFLVGVCLNYLLIFPLTVRFLGTYQVSCEVSNMLTLESYMETLLMMSVIFGIIFEIPILSLILAKIGLLNSIYMIKYRRHTVVAILIVAAIITPTGDAFTLFLVSLPIWILYEASILIVKSTENKIS